MTRILLINPNTSARSTAMMLAVARPLLPAGVTISGITAARGAAMILDEAALAVAAAETLRIGAAAGQVDAIVVAAFGNPGAHALADRLSVPVIGIGEAAMREASGGGRRFGVATTTPGLVGAIEAGVRELGAEAHFTGVRVADGDPLTLAANPDRQDAALARAAMACIARDGAAAVVIGGGPLSDTAAGLRRRFDATIIEPVPAAIRDLLRRRFSPAVAWPRSPPAAPAA